MKKLLYISMSLDLSFSGGSLVSRTNLNVLKRKKNFSIKEIALIRKTNLYSWEIFVNQSKIKTAINNLCGYAGKLNKDAFKKIKKIISEYQPFFLYLDSSLLGSIAEWCKKTFCTIKIVTFLHNVEIDFEWARIRSGKLYFFPSILSTFIAEKKAIKYSNYLITMHLSDSNRLSQLYHRKADYLIPVCIPDDPGLKNFNFKFKKRKEIFTIGFIGTAFFANIQAAAYICKCISPSFLSNKKIKFIIAGKGFEKYKKKFSRSNLEVYGFIYSLLEFYKNIDVILSPIKCGAGMKVKIAEALKYNKKIIASSFSLIGYEQLISNIGIISCNYLHEYINAIKFLVAKREEEASTRALYKKYYSEDACQRYFNSVL